MLEHIGSYTEFIELALFMSILGGVKFACVVRKHRNKSLPFSRRLFRRYVSQDSKDFCSSLGGQFSGELGGNISISESDMFCNDSQRSKNSACDLQTNQCTFPNKSLTDMQKITE